ncbi:Fanconi-associated nuclease 1-like protein [Psilocybe cubensis]|uniref:Fanconi-associated nuclease 1-like protein n=2 Tax=Psilocybe cubensis TaxID=181762 RepID=A0ACB8H9P6_PSICU|nr:Fanconi-associated nuclease 1-like protein [Psilocybe cubensis]KAH9484539.1 Fanconi-associated nuclease 1-like protein [Psilocybe cubensis]
MNNFKLSRRLQTEWQLIFGGGDTLQASLDSLEERLDKVEEDRPSQDKSQWPSAYVSVFEEMISTVLKDEPFLLSPQEIDLLQNFSMLSYNARYCLVRLVLRKADQWHPLSALTNYERELGPGSVEHAISDLCQPIEQIMNQKYEPKMEETAKTEIPPERTADGHEIIDLTMYSDEEDVKPVVIPSSPEISDESNPREETRVSRELTPEERLHALLQPPEDEGILDRFCEDESCMSTSEVLGRLAIPQLKELGKRFRCKFKPGSKKSDMIYMLQCSAATQSILPDYRGKGKTIDKHLKQSQLPFVRTRPRKKGKITQEEHLKGMALKELGKCVRVKHEFYRLVRRLHIICYRETEHPTALLLPALLTRFKKRDYTGYQYARSNNIWSSRDELLEYERALELNSILDELIDAIEDKSSRRSTKAPSVRAKDKFSTPINTASGAPCTTPLKTPGSISNIKASKTPFVKKEEESEDEEDESKGVEAEESPLSMVSKEEQIKKYLDEWIYPEWQNCINKRRAEIDNLRPPGLERFESGHVFTRMLHKATKALGPLKEYKQELKIINDLLNQTFWRRGKRSQWYERRAIILGHLTRQAGTKEDKQELMIETLEGVKEALQDEDTTLVFRPGLVKRLLSLEIKLGVPPSERSRSEGKLEPAPETTLYATRVYPPQFDRQGLQKENAQGGIYAYVGVKSNSTNDSKPPEAQLTKKKLGQKSSWKGRNGEIVNVEQRALEHYEEQGFKGFHCETRILTTIFALLFWDIIFADVPGAFETMYQEAPLDMFEETFKDARKDLIDRRLDEIRNGNWRDIAEKHDNAYREKKTWCIGVNWDLCTREELLDILECFGANSLATICQHFCDDYKGRSSGGPDLFIWKAQEGEHGGICKFVEVKGPGDSPQANQKVWFDCLHRAKVAVEICWVKDESQPQVGTNAHSSRKRKARTASASVGPSRRKKQTKVESQSDEEDYDLLDPEPEEGADFLSPLAPSEISLKRRRVSPRKYTLGLPQGLEMLPFSNTVTAQSLQAMSPSRLPKATKVENA